MLGALARCMKVFSVFTPKAVELIPADSHYYIRFAMRQLARFPHFDTFDPFVNFPTGAKIYWPPLHTWFVAAVLSAVGLQMPEVGAALVDPLLGVVELIILGLLALRLLGRPAALLITGLYALVPGVVFSGAIGCADHHVHEPFFAAVLTLLVSRTFVTGARSLAVAAGLTLGVSRLFTPIEPLLLVPTALAFLLVVALTRDSQRTQAIPQLAIRTGVTAASVLLLSALAFGEPWSVAYEPLSAFQPLFALALFLGAAAVGELLLRRRRGVWLLLAAFACAAPLSGELVRAASHFGRLDPILATVDESQPLTLRQGFGMLGVTLWLLPFTVIGVVRLLRRRTAEIIPALVSSIVLGVAAFQQFRFSQPLVGPVIVLTALALPSAFDGWRGEHWWRRVFYSLGAVRLLGALVPLPSHAAEPEMRLTRPSMFWIHDHTPPASPDPYGDSRPSYAIVANAMDGHFISLWAERPVVATTFSQAPAHVAGNERGARVFAASTEDDAYRRMLETGGRYLVLTPLLKPLGHPEIDETRTYAASLYVSGGLSAPGSEHFRLTYDSAESLPSGHGSYLRLFEAVPGAVISGVTAPDTTVTARLVLKDNLERELTYVREATADRTGRYRIRVAYPTVDASRPAVHAQAAYYTVSAGDASGQVPVPAEAVASGTEISAGALLAVASGAKP